jgi:hypothetical protein
VKKFGLTIEKNAKITSRLANARNCCSPARSVWSTAEGAEPCCFSSVAVGVVN